MLVLQKVYIKAHVEVLLLKIIDSINEWFYVMAFTASKLLLKALTCIDYILKSLILFKKVVTVLCASYGLKSILILVHEKLKKSCTEKKPCHIFECLIHSTWTLHLQEEMMKHLPSIEDKQLVEQQLLHPENLIKLCLEGEGRELSLWAFDVLAWTSSSFRKIHRKLLEECWKKAASQDDWSKFFESYKAEGWSDEETLRNLSNTLLFQASRRCYGPQAETFEEGFDQVFPLREENSETPILGDMSSSVEALLMQHKDFPVAGKLMLMAIMLGCELENAGLEEGLSPME